MRGPKDLEALLGGLYGARAGEVRGRIEALIDSWKAKGAFHGSGQGCPPLGPGDMMVISYGDSIRDGELPPLRVLRDFLSTWAGGAVTALHLLPMYPSTSDDGFSVVDYRAIDPALGSWEDIGKLAKDYDLMFDAVVNHVSRSGPWFQGFLNGQEAYANFFIKRREAADYSQVVRPRSLPLFSEVDTVRGREAVWTTFSEDQVDLNFAEPAVLVEVLDTLALYASRGARYIRLDAVGFVWKEEGTSCLNLAGAHALVKLARLFLDEIGSGTRLITETNVPHAENLAYFGKGDEAHLVYQFPLPPLVLHAFLSGTAVRLSAWASSLAADPLPAGCAWFNFLASHDGIGLRPTEGVLDDQDRDLLVRSCLERGGRVGYRAGPGGEDLPYELNINYMDALCDLDASAEERQGRFLAAHAILLSLAGLPGIYIHSLLGSRNWVEGARDSGIKRRINREKLEAAELGRELSAGGSRSRILSGLSRLMELRAGIPALAPASHQAILDLDPRVFAVARGGEAGPFLALVNVSAEELRLELAWEGRDILEGVSIGGGSLGLGPFQVRWLVR